MWRWSSGSHELRPLTGTLLLCARQNAGCGSQIYGIESVCLLRFLSYSSSGCPGKDPPPNETAHYKSQKKKLSKILLIRFQINLIPKLRISCLLFMFSYLPDKMMNIGWVACNFDLGIYFLNINRQGNILYLHGHSVFYWVKIKYMYKYQNTSKYASLCLNCIIFYQTFDYRVCTCSYLDSWFCRVCRISCLVWGGSTGARGTTWPGSCCSRRIPGPGWELSPLICCHMTSRYLSAGHLEVIKVTLM